VADIVGQDDEVTVRIQQLPGAEQHAGELRPEELLTRAAGAVQDQYGVGHVTLGVANRFAQGGVVQAQRR